MTVTSRSLKFAAALIAVHLVLFALLKLDQGGSAYAVGQIVGKLFVLGIAVFALLRVAKYGWGVSLFIVVGSLLSEARGVVATVSAASPSDSISLIWILFSIVNAPLVATVFLLLLESSRAPFRSKRKSGPNS